MVYFGLKQLNSCRFSALSKSCHCLVHFTDLKEPFTYCTRLMSVELKSVRNPSPSWSHTSNQVVLKRSRKLQIQWCGGDLLAFSAAGGVVVSSESEQAKRSCQERDSPVRGVLGSTLYIPTLQVEVARYRRKVVEKEGR